MISIAISAVVCILGLILFIAFYGQPHPKWSEVGLWMFAIGLLVTLLRWPVPIGIH